MGKPSFSMGWGGGVGWVDEQKLWGDVPKTLTVKRELKTDFLFLQSSDAQCFRV